MSLKLDMLPHSSSRLRFVNSPSTFSELSQLSGQHSTSAGGARRRTRQYSIAPTFAFIPLRSARTTAALNLGSIDGAATAPTEIIPNSSDRSTEATAAATLTSQRPKPKSVFNLVDHSIMISDSRYARCSRTLNRELFHKTT